MYLKNDENNLHKDQEMTDEDMLQAMIALEENQTETTLDSWATTTDQLK